MHFKNPIRIELVVVAFITDTFSFSNDGPNVAFKPLCQRDKLQDGSERNPDGRTNILQLFKEKIQSFANKNEAFA